MCHVQGHGWDSEKSDLVEDIPAYCRWDWMAFKGPFQPKPFHDTKISNLNVLFICKDSKVFVNGEDIQICLVQIPTSP